MAQNESRRISRRRRLLSATLLGLAFAGRAEADAVPPSRQPGPPHTRLIVSLGGAWNTTNLLNGATEPGRGTLAVQLGWRRTLAERPGFLLEWALEVVPLEPEFGTRLTEPARLSDRETAYGAGLDPLGVEARFGRGRLRPYAALRTGFRVFGRPVPTARGTRFNFVLDAGAGLELRVREGRWAFLGVELHHLSNGGLGDANPSLNLLVLRGGLAVRR